MEDPGQSIYTPVLPAPLKQATIKIKFHKITYEMRSIFKKDNIPHFLTERRTEH